MGFKIQWALKLDFAPLITSLLCLWLRGFWCQQQAFRIQPNNVTAVAGSIAILQCEVENPSGVVQWVKNGLLLGPERVIPGFPRYTMFGDQSKGEHHLQITGCELQDDASYECQVGRSETSYGIISRTALLDVLIPPKTPLLKQYQADSIVTWVAGLEYTVTCDAPDAKPAAEITFTKSGSALSGVTSEIRAGSKEKLSHTEATVMVTPQSADNGNRFACGARNDAITTPAVAGFIMNVLFPPQSPMIEGYNQPEVKAGENLKLTCTSTSGNPLATLQWSKNEAVISTSWETDESARCARSTIALEIKPEDNMATLSCEALNQVTPLPLRSSITLKVVFLPTKVTILGSSSVQEHKEISMSCFTAASNPPVQIRWWLGWKELVNTVVTITDADNGGKITMSNLTHTAVREDNGLQLTCEAFNEAVLYTKMNSITVTVQYPPHRLWIEAPPQERRFRAGTPVKLTCFCSGGNPPPRLTWFKDDKALKEGTPIASGKIISKEIISGKIVSKEIVIITAPNDNLARYRCNASSVGKTPPLTAQTQLNVQFPAINVNITATAKTVRRGQTITLNCISGSSNPLSALSWFKDGEILKGVDLGKKNAVYGGISTLGRVTLIASSSDNGRRVTCQAYSAVLNEAVLTFHQLNILYPPEFSDAQLKVVTAVEHGAVRLPLLVSANPPKINYTWSFRGENLIREGAHRHHLRDGGTLEIWNLTRADAGDYKIHCKNEEGENQTVIKLDVQYSPGIKSIGDPTEVDLGGTVEILCTVDANPITDSMFQWKWLGEDERDLASFEKIVDGDTGKLVVREAKRSDAGRYECAVDNGIAPPVKSDARLIVRFKPEIQKGVHLSKVAATGDGTQAAALVCKAEGIPNVQFSWAKKGVTLDSSSPRYSEKTLHEGSIHTSTLIIVNVSASLDYALFTCTATNPLGVDSFDIQLVSTSRPDPPTNLQVVSFTHNSVTLAWDAGFDGGLEQKFRVRYYWKEAPSFMYVDVFPPQAPTFTITGLNPSTSYNFSVNSINAFGESDYADGGAVLTVTTKETRILPSCTSQPRSPALQAFVLPLYLIVTLAAMGAVILISNATFIGCLIRKRCARSAGEEVTKAESSQKVALNEYGELINIGAKKTLLIDSGSEISSSTYDSYSNQEDSSSDAGLHYYPARDYKPSLFPHYEIVEGETDDTPSVADSRFRAPWMDSSDLHEYEEVRDRSIYEEVGGFYPQPRSATYGARGEQQIEDFMGVYHRRGPHLDEHESPMRSYNEGADFSSSGRNYEAVPYEMRGQLV
ncbi:nephrin [Pleurodeles waltl]|uniref:nephrin n=1 Tax=Pleurodeles waltl TaxID=8319 RepID=UPI003709A75A